MLFYSENNDVNSVVERIVSCEEPYETLGGDANSADLHHIWTVKDAEVEIFFVCTLAHLCCFSHLLRLVHVFRRTFVRFNAPSTVLSTCTSRTATIAPPLLASKFIFCSLFQQWDTADGRFSSLVFTERALA